MNTPVKQPQIQTQPRKMGKAIIVLCQIVVLACIAGGWWVLFRKEALPPTASPVRSDVPKEHDMRSSTSPVMGSDTVEIPDGDLESAVTSSVETDANDEAEVLDPKAAEWDAFAWSIVDAILHQAYADAQVIAESAKQVTHDQECVERLAEIEVLLKDLPMMDELVMSGFTRVIGQEILLTQNGRERRVIIRAVSANAMSAVEVTGTGTVNEKNAVTIRASTLDPKEKLKWLGNANTSSRALMKCILHQKAGNLDQARQYAEKSGPLADQLVAWVDMSPVEEPAVDEETNESLEEDTSGY